MAISLNAMRDRAREEFPGLELDLDNGQRIRFRPVVDLNDDEMERFNAVHTALSESDESGDLRNLRGQFIDLLCLVADRPDDARPGLQAETLGTVITIFKEYAKTVPDAAKSESDS